ncbi:type II secretion system F family protein [Antarcticirhabdus aurantiaca]|uniref:Type II secretion system F family protein n=1 Tax=Antarcticirhabdus aurantiaca TaxID=2606717 RepID=A0ACD4NM03_9HYPH|nr:type II secretion system F family protein [Antarcticirhabdus aurantiaca]WAJ27834.1 type II secretion system F family protein [Jeongeuplla avenae]
MSRPAPAPAATRFRFEAIDASGRRRSGHVEAASRTEAAARAGANGARLLTLEAVPAAEPFWRRDLFGTGGTRIRGADRLALVKDLSTLLGAELTVDRALRLAHRQAPKSLKAPLAAVLADVLAGRPFSRALAAHPAAFPAEMVEMAAAGEATGSLGRVLADYAVSLERREAVRRTVVSALIYPALLFVMAGGIVGLVVGVLVPSLSPLFDQPGVEKPAVIRLVEGVQGVLATHWPLVLGTLGAGVAILAALWRRPGFLAFRERLLLTSPLLGPVLVGVEAARLARVLGTLLAAEVPVPAALAVARRIPKTRAFRDALAEAARRVPEGARLAAALSRLGPLSPLTLQMIATGEEVNRLPQMLLHAAHLHEEAVETRIGRLFAVMTPAITGILGLVIGALILSIMSAILSVNDLAVR